MDPYLGEIRLFGGTFAPQGWALCAGQLLSIQQYTALFSLLGTQYGGNGTTNFALPNLQGNAALHVGQGPGLSSYSQGQTGGEAAHTLILAEIPAHTHSLSADSQNAADLLASGNLLGKSASRATSYYGASGSATPMGTNAVGPNTGGGTPHSNQQPYLALTYIIAMQGVFPPRP